MTSLLSCVEVEPSRPAVASVLWLHGLGASGHDFEPIVPLMGLPGARFVFPHAPELPVTINGGMIMPSWYDIKDLERREGREDEGDIRRSAALVEALLQREHDRGIPSDAIVLGGFSQGAAMTLHVGLRYSQPLAGLCVLSGYLLLESTFDREAHSAQRETPLLFGHGSFDPMLPAALGERARDTVSGWSNAAVDWKAYPMGHEVSRPQLDDLGAWLRARLPAAAR